VTYRSEAAGWSVGRYQSDDEHAIRELFASVFGATRTLRHWRWQFRDNPYGGPYVSIARRNDGAVVGSYGVMALKLNLIGKPVLIGESVDTAVRPDHRGQRVFEETAKDCYEFCASEGMAAVIGFPNHNSLPGFIRNLGWTRITSLDEYRMRLGVADVLQRRLNLKVLTVLGDAVYRCWIGLRLWSWKAWSYGRTLNTFGGATMSTLSASTRTSFSSVESCCRHLPSAP